MNITSFFIKKKKIITKSQELEELIGCSRGVDRIVVCGVHIGVSS